jgi:hypothetical protein
MLVRACPLSPIPAGSDESGGEANGEEDGRKRQNRFSLLH